QESLHVRAVRPQGVHKRLKYGDAVFGSIALLSERGESKPVSCAISQGELAILLNAFVLRILKTAVCRGEHTIKFLLRSGLSFELPVLCQFVEFLFAHERGPFRSL